MLQRSLLLVALAAGGLTLSADAQQWSKATPDYSFPGTSGSVVTGIGPAFFQTRGYSMQQEYPGRRYWPAMSTSPSSAGGKVLMFGGRVDKVGGSPWLGDSWEWDGKKWAKLATATSPSVRESGHMTFDWLKNEAVMFSGWDNYNYLKDTWAYTGTNWVKKSLTTQPAGRDWSDLEFHFGTQESMLFGGHIWQNVVAGLGQEGDTWTWNGTTGTWTDRTSSLTVAPTARSRHCMSWDGNTGSVVLIGGTSAQANPDMWAWTGSAWFQLTPATIPAPLDGQMAWDATRQRVVLHGGVTGPAGTPALQATWEWDGTNWSQTSNTGPAVGATHMVYDPLRQEMVLFGGGTSTGYTTTVDDTWRYK